MLRVLVTCLRILLRGSCYTLLRVASLLNHSEQVAPQTYRRIDPDSYYGQVTDIHRPTTDTYRLADTNTSRFNLSQKHCSMVDLNPRPKLIYPHRSMDDLWAKRGFISTGHNMEAKKEKCGNEKLEKITDHKDMCKSHSVREISKQVCIDLCLPFWRCKPLHKTANEVTFNLATSRSGSDLETTPEISSEGRKDRRYLNQSQDSLVPASSRDVFFVKTPYPTRASNLTSESSTSNLGMVSRSLSRSLTPADITVDMMSLNSKHLSSHYSVSSLANSVSSLADSVSLDKSVSLGSSMDTSSSLSCYAQYELFAKLSQLKLLKLDDHINQALSVSSALWKGLLVFIRGPRFRSQHVHQSLVNRGAGSLRSQSNVCNSCTKI